MSDTEFIQLYAGIVIALAILVVPGTLYSAYLLWKTWGSKSALVKPLPRRAVKRKAA